jgi:hypothetical protein
MTRTTIANIDKKKTIMQVCTRSSKMMLNHILDYKDYVADRENTFKSYKEPFDV